MKNNEDNKVGVFVRVLAGIMASLILLVIYKIVTDSAPFSEEPLALNIYIALISMLALLVTFIVAAIYGQVPRILMRIISRGRYKG